MTSVRSEYEKLLGFREGAHFCKMDLHTHSPASECSSFQLPSVLESRIKSLKKGLKNKNGLEAARSFLEQLKTGKDVFTSDYASPECTEGPRVSPRPALGINNLKHIAGAWLGDIAMLQENDTKGLRKILNGGLRDVRAYLASLFWPEEYIMRCYLESIEVVALTDHNHPGYIVPRLPELGTWYGALQMVNDHWRKDLLPRKQAGQRVRSLMVERIKLAIKRLEANGVTLTDDSVTRRQHVDRPKNLAKPENRLNHAIALRDRWSRDSSIPRLLALLPGIEITVSNVHVLAIFPPTWYVQGRIAGILGDIGIPESQWGRGFEAAASASFQTTIQLVHEAGGIAIPAHANSDFKGLLRLFKKGLALQKVLEHKALIALETIGGTVLAGSGGKKGKDACETLKYLNTKNAKTLCFTKGSDSHECRLECDGTGEDLGSRFTWVKIDLRSNDTPDEVFRALQLALRSGHNRIVEFPTEDSYNYRGGKNDYRISSEDRDQLVNWKGKRPIILGLTVAGAGSYADDIMVRFGPYLNCVIGSGGKSTLLRLLGYAFGASGFMPETKTDWLPELVRAYWLEGEETYCVERKGRATQPDDEAVQTRWLRRAQDGEWVVLHESPDASINSLADRVGLWPSREVQDKEKKLSHFEGRVLGDLLRMLERDDETGQRPLLVNQPHEIFNGERLFDTILNQPLLRDRQILWSTGSPNVPAALDAEKIIVTGEKKSGKVMHVVCGGDLHEDEIRDQLLNHFEGGASAFYKRQALYDL